MAQQKHLAPTAVAIVGMGCRFPGGVRDASSLWQLLVDGRTAVGEVPDDRWNAARFFHPDPAAIGRMVTRRGGFVDQPKNFDAAFWGISPREAMRMDPQQRWLLETAWEAIEDAGIAPRRIRGSQTGVFVGAASHDYGTLQSNDLANLDVHTNTGGTLSIAANRISYLFDFKGPSIAIDTACSSALVAISMAYQAIVSGECAFALAGGVNALITPNTSIGFSKASMLSPAGECFAFDQRANGYVRGEGAGLVLLKPLTRALEDHDPIYAVIRGAMVNQDGHTSSMTVPSVDGQSEMLRNVYRQAGISPHQVVYVESHGTGTPVGDPIEANALGTVLAPGRPSGTNCLIGSIKTNIGHLESASGVAGLIKAALVLDQDTVPANTNFQTPNADIPFETLKLKVADTLQPLPHVDDADPVVGVNSFGFGGTNAHVVMEAAPRRPQRDACPDRNQRPYLLPISARDEASLQEYATAYRRQLDQCGDDLADFCFSAGARKEQHAQRLVFIGHDAQQLQHRLDSWLHTNEAGEGIVHGNVDRFMPSSVFVFTGQGSQWSGMGQQLVARERIARQTLDEIDALFQPLSGWSLAAEMSQSKQRSNIDRTDVAQPAIFALQVALVRLWQAWGIEPTAVVGHSVGEVAAAWCAGIYSLSDAVRLVYHRSRLQNTTGGHGRMLAAGITPDEAKRAIGERSAQVQVTAVNSAALVTLGGDSGPLEEIASRLQQQGKFVRWLKLDYAFHTHQMDPIRRQLLDALADLEPRSENLPFVSSVTGRPHPGTQLDADYWWNNVRQPVLFEPAVSHLISQGEQRFLEIGPHPSLRSSLRETLASHAVQGNVLHSLRRESDESLELATSLAELHVAGAAVDWQAVNQSPGNFIRQPAYPWNYKEFWFDRGDMVTRVDPRLHPFLGDRLKSAKPTWQWTLDPHLFPYLNHHRIWDRILFPAAGYVEIGLAVADALFPGEQCAVEDLELNHPLFTAEDAPPTVQVVFEPESRTYSVFSSSDHDHWELHGRGRVVTVPAPAITAGIDLQELQNGLPQQTDHEPLYQALHAFGYGFGPDFSLIQRVWSGSTEDAPQATALAEIQVPGHLASSARLHRFHPALLDACFQATHGTRHVATDTADPDHFYLPTAIRQVQLHRSELPTTLYAVAQQTHDHGDEILSDIRVYDPQGEPVAEIRGFQVQKVKHNRRTDGAADCLYQFLWEPQPVPGTEAAPDEKPGEHVSDTSESDRSESDISVSDISVSDISVSDRSVSDRSVSDRSESDPGQSNASAVLLFADASGVADGLIESFARTGTPVIHLRRGSEFAQHSDHAFTLTDGSVDELRAVLAMAAIGDPGLSTIVHCWSLDAEADQIDSDSLLESQRLGALSCLRLAHLLSGSGLPQPPRVYVVTRGVHAVVDDDAISGLAAAPLVGFCRVAQNELEPFQWTLIDLDGKHRNGKPPACETVSLFQELQRANDEREVAFRADRRHVHRLRRVHTDQLTPRRRNARQPDGGLVPYRLQMTRAGILEDLSLNETPRKDPAEHEIEVRVAAGGINFRDVMKALGMYPGNPPDAMWFGDDFSGIVERVGRGVHDLRPGDGVAGIAPYSFRSHVTVDRRMTIKQPADMSFAESATLSTVFLTTHFAIHQLARMKAGEKILIHAAAGGIGQAAIQVAQHLGLEIFATASTEEKHELLRSLGVQHVMNSRTFEFVDRIQQLTAGQGVDAVLNSLAGEFIPKSLSVLAPFGRFLEIGKTDVYGNAKLGLAAFKNNISYHVLDLAQVIAERPALVKATFDEIAQRIAAGDYRPLTHQVFPITEVVDAFRFMAQGHHVGKNVLSFDPARSTENPDSVAAETPAIPIGPCTQSGHLFRRDASYLITGGAGGFGLEVAKWMVQQGARTLVLLSRSGPGEKARGEIEALRAEGVQIIDFRGDVTNQEDVRRAVNQIHSAGPPLQGVLHAAMVLDDAFLTELDEDRFNRVLHPKMLGAWNLHIATRGLALEHFICFSSFSAVIGATRQASYNAGNCFLDALAQHRRACGMPALTLNWGAVLGAGFVERNQKTAQYLANVGLNAFQMDEALEILGELVLRDAALVGVGRVDWTQLSKLSPAVASSPTFAEMVQEPNQARSGGSLQSQLANATPDQRLGIVEQFMVQQVAGVFGIDAAEVDPTMPLTNLGLDSLMAVELINRIESETSTTVPMSGLLNGPSVQKLSGTILDLLAMADNDATGEQPPQDSRGPAQQETEVHYASDIQLCATIQPRPVALPVISAPRIFLTGATGFLGAQLLNELLRETTSPIVCLIRAADEPHGLKRIAENLDRYGLSTHGLEDRVTVLVGDFSKKWLGLTELRFDQLASEVDVIYHNGADVNLLLPYASLRAANVLGTQEILRLACHQQPKPTHFVSTFTVQATEATRGQRVTETDPLPPFEELLYGYSRTKWASEQLLSVAQSRGLPVTIYRPGHITGDSRTGAANVNDLLHTIVLACLRLGAAPFRDVHLDLTPVDYVAKAMVHLSQRPESTGKTFHLTNPHPLTTESLLAWMQDSGSRVELIAYEQWRERLADLAETSDASHDQFHFLMDVLLPNASGDDNRGLHPVFDCTEALNGLAGSEIACPPANEKLLSIGHAYLQRTGVVPPSNHFSGRRLVH